jgi:tetratricopeptide (TPR) repeat protein
MGQRRPHISLILLIAAMIMSPFVRTQACGPQFPTPIFTNFKAPDCPMESYAKGKLGVLERGYEHIYLYVAYRNLIGKPFSDKEVKSIWGSGNQQGQTASQVHPTDWIDAWSVARAQIAGNAGAPNLGFHDDTGIYRAIQKPGVYVEYYNCLQGAFESAVAVLNRTIAQFGAGSPYVKQWVDAQDQVFENCSAGTGYPPEPPTAVIPAAAPQSDPQVMREARAYQIAAAHFYAGDYPDARTEFAAIADDPASPYDTIAPYLVARTLVREGTLGNDIGQNDQALAQAEQKLQEILADGRLAKIHSAARAELGFVEIRLHPRERAKELEAALLNDKMDPNFSQDLTDYLWLLNNSPRALRGVSSSAIADQHVSKPGAISTAADMTVWILSFQSGPDLHSSFTRWKRTGSLPWLVAAISQEWPTDLEARRLEAAALKVPPNSPAYVTVTFHRLRLLAQSGHAEEARKAIDEILAEGGVSLSESGPNEFLALRMSLNTSLEDLLRYAPRVPSDMNNVSDANPGGPLFDSDGAVVLSEDLPLQMLADAARSAELPVSLRTQVAIAAWTRAVLLNDDRVAREIAPRLAAIAPELQKPLSEYAAEKSTSARRFAAVFLILRFPGLRPFVTGGLPRFSFDGPEQLEAIDSYRDNWWCMIEPTAAGSTFTPNFYTADAKLSPPLREVYPDGQIPLPTFLNASQREALGKERSVLQALPSAPTWLAQQVLNWAKSHPDDPRVPEALHDAVRASRYGCFGADSGKVSKEAFEQLHSRYPNSPWTKKTPYWFNN